MKTFELKNTSNSEQFGQSSMDWFVMSNGRLSAVAGGNRLTQQILKILFIDRQLWGYGASIGALKGGKDIDVMSGAAVAMISQTLQNLRQFQDQESLMHDIVPAEEVISGITKLLVDQRDDPTKFKITLHVTDGNGEELQFESER